MRTVPIVVRAPRAAVLEALALEVEGTALIVPLADLAVRTTVALDVNSTPIAPAGVTMMTIVVPVVLLVRVTPVGPDAPTKEASAVPPVIRTAMTTDDHVVRFLTETAADLRVEDLVQFVENTTNAVERHAETMIVALVVLRMAIAVDRAKRRHAHLAANLMTAVVRPVGPAGLVRVHRAVTLTERPAIAGAKTVPRALVLLVMILVLVSNEMTAVAADDRALGLRLTVVNVP